MCRNWVLMYDVEREIELVDVYVTRGHPLVGDAAYGGAAAWPEWCPRLSAPIFRRQSYICIYNMRICVSICISLICAYMQTAIYIYIHMYMCIYIYIYICIHVYINIIVCIRMYVCMCVM